MQQPLNDSEYSRGGRRWVDGGWEDTILEDWGGETDLTRLVNMINKERQSRGLPRRTRHAVEQRCQKLNISTRLMDGDRKTLYAWSEHFPGVGNTSLYAAYDQYAEKFNIKRRPQNGKVLIVSLPTLDKVLAWKIDLAMKIGLPTLKWHGFSRAAKALANYKPPDVDPGNRPTRRVRNVTTGEVFHSVSDAARRIKWANKFGEVKYGVPRSTMGNSITARRLVKGQQFEFVDPPIEYQFKEYISMPDNRRWSKAEIEQQLGVKIGYVVQAAKGGFEIAGRTWEIKLISRTKGWK